MTEEIRMFHRIGSNNFWSTHRSARWMRGQAAVEMAMSVVLWLMLVIGVIEFAYAMYCFNQVSDAAKLGTRYAIVHGTTSSSPASTSQLTSYIVSQVSGLDTSSNDGYFKVCAACGTCPGSSSALCSSQNPPPQPPCAPGTPVCVQVNYKYRFAESLVPHNLSSLNLTANSQGTVAQ